MVAEWIVLYHSLTRLVEQNNKMTIVEKKIFFRKKVRQKKAAYYLANLEAVVCTTPVALSVDGAGADEDVSRHRVRCVGVAVVEVADRVVDH